MSIRLAAALLLAASAPAFAQPSPLIIDRDRIDRAPPVERPAAPPARPQRGGARNEGGVRPDVMLAEVRIVGASIDRAALAPAWRPFVGKPLDKPTIDGVAQGVAALYARSDAAIYTVLVPRQDLSTGRLTLRVIEGRISGVVIDDDRGRAPAALVARQARPLTEEKPLRRATLERQLSLIRDIPGLTADAAFLPAPEDDALRLGLKLKRKPFDVSFSADNRGTTSLGGFQYQAKLTANGLITDADQTQLTAAASGDFERYRYLSLSHGLALDASGTRLFANAGYLRTRPDSTPVDGDAVLAGLQVSRPILRGYTRNLTATAALDGVDNDNAAFGTTVAREHSRAARAALAFSRSDATQTLALSATASKGLNGLGATAAGGFVELGFAKLNARAGYDRHLGKAVTLRLRAAAQYSRDRLPSVETFALGGDEFGRAFRNAALLGDRGVAGSAEVGVAPPDGLPKIFAGTELYGFVDGGLLRIVARAPFAGQSSDLASAGAGVRLNLARYGWIGLEGARSLDKPSAGANDGWRAVVSWRLHIG